MNNLIQACIRNRSVTIFTIILVLIAGILSFTALPQNEFPAIKAGFMKIFTYWPGAMPEDVETYVSKPLERTISKHDGIYKLKSESLAGISIVTVRLADAYTGNDASIAFQQIRSYISDIKPTLPPDIIGPYINDRIGESEAYIFALTCSSSHRSYRELQAILNNIRDEFKTVPGVGDCNFYGDRPEKIFIDLATEDLAVLGIHPGQIIEGIKSQNIQMAQPMINLCGKQLSLEVTGLYKSMAQIRDTIIYADPAGHIYRVKDLKGKVSLGYDDPPRWQTLVNGQKSIILSISMKRGYHIVKWGRTIEQKAAHIRSKLPADLTLEGIFSEPEVVKHSVSQFMRSFFEAILLVVIIIGLGLGRRNAGIVAITIPLIIFATFAVMNALKIELNESSIAGLIVALGILVDNSVVVIDNIERYLQMGMIRAESVFKGVTQVAPALLVGTATLFSAFFVLTLMPGPVSEAIRPFMLVICAAIIISYFTALLVAPTIASMFSKAHRNSNSEIEPASRLRTIYFRFVELTQKHKSATIAVLLLGFIAIIGVGAAFIPQAFFPYANRGQFLVHINLPEGWDINATRDKARQIEGELEKMKDAKFKGKPLVLKYVSYLGQSGPRFLVSIMPKPPQSRYAQIMVITPGDKQTLQAVKHLREYIANYTSGAIIDVRRLELAMPVDFPVEVRIKGNDPKSLKEIAKQVEKILRSIKGISNITNDYGADSQKLVIKVNQEKAKMLGLSSRDVAMTLYTGVQGYPVSSLNAPERQIDIVLRLQKNKRQSIDDLKAILFTSPQTGAKHRLDEFAQIYLDSYPSAIVRQEEIRTLTLGANISENRQPDDILKAIRPKIKRLSLPDGYSISYGGQKEESDKAFGELLPWVALALILMFLILTYKFKSVRIALAIYMSLPMALTGAVVGLFVMRQPLGFMAAIGLSSLGGIVIYNAIVLVDFIHNNLKSGQEVLEAVKEAGYLRIRPIMMTASCAICGLFPLALSHNPMFEPLCWVIIFGLAFCTVMTLLMTPFFFVLLGGPDASLKNIASKPQD